MSVISIKRPGAAAGSPPCPTYCPRDRSAHYRMAAAGPPASPGGHRCCLRVGSRHRGLRAVPGWHEAGYRLGREASLNRPRRRAAAVGVPYRQPSASSCTVLE